MFDSAADIPALVLELCKESNRKLYITIVYGNFRHLIIIDRGEEKTTNGNFSHLKEIIEKGGTTSNIVKAFPLENLTDAGNFKFLLFYFGLLTIDGIERDKVRLRIPNETIKRLYYYYITEAYRETDFFDLDLSRYADLISDMPYEGKWKPLFEFITERMRESMSLRDLITGEKSIQAFLNVYLGLSNLYIAHPEKELNKGYADIVMEPFLGGYEGIGYSYILEIKYIKQMDATNEKGLAEKLAKMKTDAEALLKQYTLDEKFKKSIGKTTLIKLVLIFHSINLAYIGQAG